MNNARILQIGVLIILTAVALFVIKLKPKTSLPVVTDFSSCVDAQGGQVLQTFPPICTYEGKSFVQQPPIQQASVIVDTPQPNDLVTSPLVVQGRAVGSWYFEANLPVTLKDTNGNVLAQKGFQAIGDWMTPNYVDFDDTLTFTTPATQYGVLIISKDNPSGLPQNDASFAVPVRFW